MGKIEEIERRRSRGKFPLLFLLLLFLLVPFIYVQITLPLEYTYWKFFCVIRDIKPSNLLINSLGEVKVNVQFLTC